MQNSFTNPYSKQNIHLLYNNKPTFNLDEITAPLRDNPALQEAQAQLRSCPLTRKPRQPRLPGVQHHTKASIRPIGLHELPKRVGLR